MIKNISINPAPQQRGDVTSVDLEQFARYKANGLTYVSDDINIIPRNTAGNIIIQQSASMNELLIIEPMINNISTKSVLRVIDTSFQYYKFPVSTIEIIDDTVDLDINLTADNPIPSEPDPIEIDNIYARYKPSAGYIAATYDPSKAGVNQYSGILLDEVVDGLSQTNINTYTISKELKSSGKDLRIRIKLSHQYVNLTNNNQSLFVITIGKSGPNYPLNRKWKGEFASTSPGKPWSYIYGGQLQIIYVDEIILNSEFEAGDSLYICALGGHAEHTIISEQTYVVITDASKIVNEWNQEI